MSPCRPPVPLACCQHGLVGLKSSAVARVPVAFHPFGYQDESVTQPRCRMPSACELHKSGYCKGASPRERGRGCHSGEQHQRQKTPCSRFYFACLGKKDSGARFPYSSSRAIRCSFRTGDQQDSMPTNSVVQAPWPPCHSSDHSKVIDCPCAY
jgi:hypothetical protein